MARQVFSPTSMVAHVWAQQNQDYGRNSGESVYFRGPTIYSYGRHFPMATYATTPHAGTVVIVNDRSYSMSTSRHKSQVVAGWSRGGVDYTAWTPG